MEPNNFEKDFREKLNLRTLEPSDKSWDRLDAMLSIAEEKKPKKSKKWLYIAASVVGFLWVGTFYFNQNKNTAETPKQVVVEGNTKKDPVVKTVLKNTDSVKTEIAAAAISLKESLHKTAKNHNSISNITIKKESNEIAESSIIIKNNQEKQSINNQPVIAEKVNSNVDQLLETAENKVVAENLVKPKSKIKINANDLLDQVDTELELSFRKKMIAKINKNYQTVKVTVASRNQQE